MLTYSPALARKKRLEIDEMAAKARAFATSKQVARAELGEAAKYVEIVGKARTARSSRRRTSSGRTRSRGTGTSPATT